MQTFLPYANFKKSALLLDKKRCWKQVVETHQIINILEGKSKIYQNHPAILMWMGQTELLKVYFNDFLSVCKERHHINTKYVSFSIICIEEAPPFWLGNEDFHRAMRARLIEKDEEYYLPLFPNDKGFNDGKYFWPVMESKTFRVI